MHMDRHCKLINHVLFPFVETGLIISSPTFLDGVGNDLEPPCYAGYIHLF